MLFAPLLDSFDHPPSPTEIAWEWNPLLFLLVCCVILFCAIMIVSVVVGFVCIQHRASFKTLMKER